MSCMSLVYNIQVYLTDIYDKKVLSMDIADSWLPQQKGVWSFCLYA